MKIFIVLFIILSSASLFSCGEENNGIVTYDVNAYGIPKFVDVDYIELNTIDKISRFRSGIGHDYSDDFESYRNMKHYFQPYSSIDPFKVKIYSPVSGNILKIFEEWAGTQIQIQSNDHPAFFFSIFHVNLIYSFNVHDFVIAGQLLGTHIGSQTMSDIAVGVYTPNGWKLVSYFDAMTDSLFQAYQARGLNSRDDIIISKAERDADPLICKGDTIKTLGILKNWVILK
jgi:hypothetical protein